MRLLLPILCTAVLVAGGCKRAAPKAEAKKAFDLEVPAGWTAVERTPWTAKLKSPDVSLVVETFDVHDFRSLEITAAGSLAEVRKRNAVIERELFDDTVAGDAAKGFVFSRPDGAVVCSRVVHHGGTQVSSVQCFSRLPAAHACEACAPALSTLRWMRP